MNYVSETMSIKGMLIVALAEKPNSYIVEEILNRFTTFSELLNATEPELIEIKGIGKVKAAQVVATMKLAQRLSGPSHGQPYTIRKPSDAAELMMSSMRYLQQENFCVLLLNTKNRLIGPPQTLSIGSINSAIVTPQMVFKAAIKHSAVSVVCIHNHPSGDVTASPEDIKLTQRLVESGRTIGIDVLDHLIIGDGIYLSLREQGMM